MEKLKKIDIHAHAITKAILPFEFDKSKYWITPPELREMYDCLGIEKGVLLPLTDQVACQQPNSLAEVLDMVNQYPDTFGWWFCSIDAGLLGNNPDKDLSFYFEKYIELGAKGVGEITQNIPFDHPLMLNLFKYCEKYNMPVLFHIGKPTHTYGIIDEVGLPRLEKVLAMFPNLIFIGHSTHFWNEISGDCNTKPYNTYHTGPVTEGGRVPYLMRKYKNLHCDISAGSGYSAISRDPEFSYKFFEDFQDRIYYGADMCIPKCFDNQLTKMPDFLDNAMINEKISYIAYKKICRENALKLLSDKEE